MPDTETKIESYQYEFRALPGDEATILYLFDASGRLRCMATFLDVTGPLPEPRETPAGVVMLAYRRPALADVVDMLREERPVTFSWTRDARIARLTTGAEPVGEEETRRLLAWLAG